MCCLFMEELFYLSEVEIPFLKNRKKKKKEKKEKKSLLLQFALRIA